MKGAFSDKMQQVGDVSDPVVEAHGIHILKYLRDALPSGLIMTDAIHGEITQFLVGRKRETVYTKAFEGWLSEMEVVYNQGGIDKASQEAAAKQEDLVEQPVEAMPAARGGSPGRTSASHKPLTGVRRVSAP